MYCSLFRVSRSIATKALHQHSLLERQILSVQNLSAGKQSYINTFSKSAGKESNRLVFVLAGLSALTIVGCQQTTRSASSAANSHDKTNEMSTDYKKAESVYEFNVQDTYGKDVSLGQYKGQVLLVVNIASQCGLAKNNYKELTELKEKYHDKGLRILNFPCNQFGSQMPEADGEPMVCHLRDAKADIGDVFKKIDVNGSNAAPLYQYLKAKQGGTLGSAIKWNFTKFLVDKEGKPVNRYGPTTSPSDIAKDIEKLL